MLDLALSEANYLFVTCQAGMEAMLKADYLTQVPAARLAFSRPGLVTFKVPAPAHSDGETATVESAPQGILHRTFGRSFANVQWTPPAAAPADPNRSTRFGVKQFLERMAAPSTFGHDAPSQELIQQALANLKKQPHPHWEVLHFWVRDGLWPACQAGRGATPEPPAGVEQFSQTLHAAVVAGQFLPTGTVPNQNATFGQRVLDVCLVGPHHLLLGEHVARHSFQRWPGGVLPLVPTNPPPISRAYYKIREAVSWAGLDLRPNQLAVEMGAAPGGSCQWLLEQGLRVTGIDPADMDPLVADHPKFTHIRRRGREVKRRDLFDCDWLLSDANLPPNYVLDTFHDLLAHPRVQPRGVILTLKLPDTRLLENWAEWSAKVRSWGFRVVQGRQLIYNRQEVCLVATR